MTSLLTDAWIELVSHERPDALAWAFKKYFQTEPYFPTPAHICNLVTTWHVENKSKLDAERDEQKKLEWDEKRRKELR